VPAQPASDLGIGLVAVDPDADLLTLGKGQRICSTRALT